MDKKMICEAMYALESGLVVRRKKNYIVPGLILVIGTVLIVLNYLLDVEARSADLSSSLLLIAGATVIVGVLMVLSRLFDSEGEPWHKPTRKMLKYEERFYPLEQKEEILRLVEQGAYLKLVAADKGLTSGIAVAIYHATDLSFYAMQGYEYIDYEYQPVTAIRCVSDQAHA